MKDSANGESDKQNPALVSQVLFLVGMWLDGPTGGGFRVSRSRRAATAKEGGGDFGIQQDRVAKPDFRPHGVEVAFNQDVPPVGV